jgi:wyosine [tRNA(Phe)-imidazoG37] synthetase (radical SAM superfamily)
MAASSRHTGDVLRETGRIPDAGDGWKYTNPEATVKYIFGPVPSRRLGRSLGVDIIPFKTCTLSCVYCQLGDTPATTLERREYVPADDVLAELRAYLEKDRDIDWITFSGSGEPTLHSGIGAIIRRIKAMTPVPVCVITNGTLLHLPEVRKDIVEADAVMPSLDAATEGVFRAVCRAHPDLRATDIVEGLAAFRKEYRGKIWLEILLVAGLNDTPEELEALHEAVRRIDPDSIQLNTVVRPPADRSMHALTRERMEEVRAFFGGKAEIIASFAHEGTRAGTTGPEEVFATVARHPDTSEEIAAALGAGKEEVENILEGLEELGKVRRIEYGGSWYWER